MLTAVVVHRRRPDACIRTIAGLRAQGVHTIVVVDNASPAEERKRILDADPDVVLLENDRNLGFGPAANVGFRWWLRNDSSPYVLLCPHDAEPEPGCVSSLVDELEARPRAGMACAEYGDHEWSGKPVVDPYFGSILASTDRLPGWESCGHPHGTMMVVRRACLEEIGLFDERYFAYCEEADLGERARRAGWDVGIVWGAIVHNPGMSSGVGVPEYLMLRNSLLLVRDHFGRYNAFVRYVMATWVTVRGALGGRRTPFWDLRARMYALRDFPLGRFGPPPARLCGDIGG